jgi:hypothetical protein
MAKVLGPMHSIEARGQFAKSMVFFPWKGLQCVRRYLVPVNPRSAAQKFVRQIMACIGIANREIEQPSTSNPAGSALYQAIRDATPAGAIWNAHFAQAVLNDLSTEGNFDTYHDAMDALGAKEDWTDAATQMDLVDIPAGDIYPREIKNHEILWLAAYAAWKLKLEASADYDEDPEDWDQAKIFNFANDFADTSLTPTE